MPWIFCFKELHIFYPTTTCMFSCFLLIITSQMFVFFERYIMYMILLSDTEPESRVFTLVDVYIAQTQCLKYLCDQFCLQPHNSFSLILGLQKVSQRQYYSAKLADSKGFKNIIGIWRLLLPSSSLSQIRHFLRVNYKFV